eukprot:CAMPEP_0197833274 /NCGR_PEP_ID=MMETSP1437-20131217/18470_1 /TAXON_ID=49252 ORGANISM="Eucampia antarctica, Strain CCMP1452" /NCGR_SAMPLE_ID=MMETSP1437 /ASSEMBLY_ACC=CAM_ASM_001096 /LENGTH=94 /DNA_ID=CAMNT_0043437239 /DNA_START=36 /DNA_END=320 /DNA_ORIENTATION=+
MERKRLLDEIDFDAWSQNLKNNTLNSKGNNQKQDWNALFDQMRQRGIDANAPLSVLPNANQQDSSNEEVKFENLSEQDIIDLWNEEDDDEDGLF